MKKFSILLFLLIVCFATNAQKKSGTVYSEHGYIDKTRELWAAFVNMEKESFLTYYADSIQLVINGSYSKQSNAWMKNVFTFWKGVSNLKAEDDKGAYPDAIEYDNGPTCVQDWLRVTGLHEQSEVEIDVRVHSIYFFNDEGKVTGHVQYFDDSFFEEISKKMNPSSLSAKDREYILSLYKVMGEEWNKGNKNPYLNRYDEKTIYMVPNQQLLEGIDAIKALVNPVSTKFEFQPVEIWGSDNYAGVQGIFKGMDAQGNLLDKGKFVSSWQKDSEGNWKISHDIWNSDLAAQGATSND